jgi:hypothetical protein
MRLIALILLAAASSVLAERKPFTPTTQCIGTVIDAKTKQPVGKFFIVLRPANSPGASWQQHTFKEHADARGEFRIDLKRVWDEGAVVRVMAEGYRPGKARIDKSKTDRLEVWLKPAEPIVGKVLDDQQKPVAGAEVALASEFSDVRLESGHLRLRQMAQKAGQKVVKTTADGSFALADTDDEAVIVVAHESGFGQAKRGATDSIVLKRWARIEGQLLLGTRPGAGTGGWRVSFNGSMPKNASYSWISQWIELTCDAQGRFDSGPLVPDATMQASVQVKLGGGEGDKTGMVIPVTTFVETNSGKTLNLTLGGLGRPVIGRLLDNDGHPQRGRKLWIRTEAPHIDFSGDDEMWKANALFFQAAEQGGAKYHHEIETDDQGRFRIERLPQGSFVIDGARLGQEKSRLEIKPMEGGKSDEPMDLGDLAEFPPR